MSMATHTHDVIDELVGTAPGSRLDGVRAARRQARENAQASYDALFNPSEPGDMTAAERFAVATFVAGLHERPRVRDFYSARLAEHGDADLTGAVRDAAAAGRARGPYGAFPPGPLSREDQSGLAFAAAPETRRAIGARLSTALKHAHMLVFHPRDASPAALQALLDAGWTTTGVVTLSQLVSFLSFQIRVIDGLSLLDPQKDDAR
jgi:CMD domain protein